MQIDKEKSRFQRLIEKCQAKNNDKWFVNHEGNLTTIIWFA